MVGYKLSKNDWVTPFFVIFRSVREILLVTVFCKHPVVCCSSSFSWIWSSITIIFVFNMIIITIIIITIIKNKGNLLMVCCSSSFSSSILLFTSSKSLSRSPWELFNQYTLIYISINISSCCENYLSLMVKLKTQIFQTENFNWRLYWNQKVTCSNRTFSLFTTSNRSFALPSIWS